MELDFHRRPGRGVSACWTWARQSVTAAPMAISGGSIRLRSESKDRPLTSRGQLPMVRRPEKAPR